MGKTTKRLGDNIQMTFLEKKVKTFTTTIANITNLDDEINEFIKSVKGELNDVNIIYVREEELLIYTIIYTA